MIKRTVVPLAVNVSGFVYSWVYLITRVPSRNLAIPVCVRVRCGSNRTDIDCGGPQL